MMSDEEALGLFTRQEKKACIDREIKMRRRVYPRWVEAGKMSPLQADAEIRTMMAIAKDYEERDLLSPLQEGDKST